MAKNRKPPTPMSKKVDKLTYKRTPDGKVIKPVKYMGKHIGHGNYIAGAVEGEIIVDRDGKPIPYKSL